MRGKDDPVRASADLDYPRDLENYSFDQWCRLHEADPQLFDRYRLKLLNDLIDAAPKSSQPRLRGLMFRMEGESRRCNNPLVYNLRLSAMMMELLDEMRRQLARLSAPPGGDAPAQTAVRVADLVPFARPDDAN